MRELSTPALVRNSQTASTRCRDTRRFTASEPDRQKRAAKVAQLDAYIHDNFLAYNMMTVPSLDGINKRVKNFKQSPFETYSIFEIAVE